MDFFNYYKKNGLDKGIKPMNNITLPKGCVIRSS